MNCPHWLLALTIPFSRSDRAHTSPAGVGAGCAKGLLRTMPASLLRLPEDLGGPFRRECHCSRRVTERQRAFNGREPPGVTPGCGLCTDRSGTSAVDRRMPARAVRFPPRTRIPPATPGGGMREATRPSACHPVLDAQRAFRFPPCRQSGCWGRALPVDALDYRMSPRCDACMMNRRCCRVVTGR